MKRSELVEKAIEIADEYEADNLKLTLRQMYYQFVARGLCASGQEQYDRIGAAITEARYNGEFPVEALEDRGREIVEGDAETLALDVGAALEESEADVKRCQYNIRSAKWIGQRTIPSVWVEKQALEGIFAPVCRDLGASFFACKGYPSVSALWAWLQHMDNVCSVYDAPTPQRLKVIYFGDHDPDGWEIPRSAERNLARLIETYDLNLPEIEFERVALNMDQIQRYSPPPFEAKVTSARFGKYVREHNTDSAWELDALEPRVLRDLITSNVDKLFDRSVWNRYREIVLEKRRELRDRMCEDGWLKAALSVEED